MAAPPDRLLELAAGQGLWAALFVVLLWWVLRKNEEREQRYLSIIQTLSEDVKKRVENLERDFRRLFHRGGEE